MKELYLTVRTVEYHYYEIEVEDDFDASDSEAVESLICFGDEIPVEKEVAEEELQRIEVKTGENTWDCTWDRH